MFFALEDKKIERHISKAKITQNKLVIIHYKIQFQYSMPCTFALK